MMAGVDGTARAMGSDSAACACPRDGETLAGAVDGDVNSCDLRDG